MQQITFSILLVFAFSQVSKSQSWELKKEKNEIKAYTATSENDPVKSYKLIATINGSMDCIYDALTDYDHYTDMIGQLSEFNVLSKTGTTVITYSMIDMPWPFDNRDVITEIKTVRTENNVTITSSKADYSAIKEKDRVVRMSDYYEKFFLEKIASGQSRLTLTGHIAIGGSVPVWVQNMFITDGPFEFIEAIKKRCEHGH